jgi:hypothetical protein
MNIEVYKVISPGFFHNSQPPASGTLPQTCRHPEKNHLHQGLLFIRTEHTLKC